VLQVRLPFNDRGFTLVEVLVSILILTVALFGLLSAVEVATEQNLRNQMRDEAVQVAEAQMNHWSAAPFNNISTATVSGNVYTYSPRLIQSNLRGMTNKSYRVIKKTVASPDKNVVDLGVRVIWSFKNVSSVHEVHTVRSQ
jgi:type IV pilus assembly protein PilV